MSKILEILNPWGKVMKVVVLDLKTLLVKGVNLPQFFCVLFLSKFCLPPCLPSLGEVFLPPFANFVLPSRIFGIGATIYYSQEILCLPYAGLL